ncbi:MAG: DNA repair protein RecO [Candidatus Magasanikbacteria bacterium]|nr:DNA repair protein RecO [Candidatus Magasanikbacteria bacterium]
MTVTDSAIILSRAVWRESDKRVVFYSLQHGKVDAVAVGASKIRSKLSGHLEPLRVVEVMFAEGKNGYKIAQCVTQHNFVERPIDVERVQMMGTVARLVEHSVELGHKDVKLYELLFGTLAALEASVQEDLEIVFGAKLLSLATYFGYAPELNVCVLCGSAEHLTRFSPEHGGVICINERVQEKTMAYDVAPEKLQSFLMTFLRWRALI